jgi:nucleotide-binding universal stress UspA family protein
MADIRRILVPVDFSERALPALEWAGELARRTGAEIDVIHVWHLPTFINPSVYWQAGSDEERLSAQLENQIRASYDELASKAAKQNVTISERRIERGEPARVILDVAQSGDYDLIVMGTRGHSGLGRILGSVAARVLQHAPCPVMTVA